MLRNVLDIMQRNKNDQGRSWTRTIKRARWTIISERAAVRVAYARSSSIHLRDRVELVRFGKGDVICRQGDIADSFYLIRIGFVKVSEDHPDGELVLAYLGRGGYFGEIGLLGGQADGVLRRVRRSITSKSFASRPTTSIA